MKLTLTNLSIPRVCRSRNDSSAFVFGYCINNVDAVSCTALQIATHMKLQISYLSQEFKKKVRSRISGLSYYARLSPKQESFSRPGTKYNCLSRLISQPRTYQGLDQTLSIFQGCTINEPSELLKVRMSLQVLKIVPTPFLFGMHQCEQYLISHHPSTFFCSTSTTTPFWKPISSGSQAV